MAKEVSDTEDTRYRTKWSKVSNKEKSTRVITNNEKEEKQPNYKNLDEETTITKREHEQKLAFIVISGYNHFVP